MKSLELRIVMINRCDKVEELNFAVNITSDILNK